MNNRKKSIFCLLGALALFCIPASAVFNEKSLSETLAVLRYDLRKEYNTRTGTDDRLKQRQSSQHKSMIQLQKTCNELSLMLYSQSQDFTFDMTYALKTVTREYEAFNKSRMPFDEIISRLDIEIDRYSRLTEALRRLPPVLSDVDDLPDSLKYHNDSVNFDTPLAADIHVLEDFKDGGKNPGQPLPPASSGADMPKPEDEELRGFVLDDRGQVDRDSCLFYATSILKMYSASKDRIVKDSEHYETANLRLKESYDYARERYQLIQKKIFVDGQDSYFSVLKSFKQQFSRAMADARTKYAPVERASDQMIMQRSEWKGPMIFGVLGVVIMWLIIASALSILIIQILKRKVKSMQTVDFQQHIPCLTLLCGSIIFSISMMVIASFVRRSYISLAANNLLVFAWLLAAILFSLFVRLNGRQIKSGMKIYAPIILLGLVVIACRIIFIPNRLLNLLLPAVLVLFLLWQIRVFVKNRDKVEDFDKLMGGITAFVIFATTVIAWAGYVLLGIEILMWWLFQTAAIETISAVKKLLEDYKEKKLVKKMSGNSKVENFQVTWLFDLLNDCVIPVVSVLSVPACFLLAADIFDLREICVGFLQKSLVDLTSEGGQEILKVSCHNVIIILVLYFIFNYISYLAKSVFHDFKLRKEMRKRGGAHIHTNEINFTLANNVIASVVWCVYVISIILILKIPTGAVSVVFAGLATGLGLAMKDILNNFIYGIQLMSGRLRVGDYVECDGLRGRVSAISYQSTQLETAEGAIISYLNTSLFDKNFKNLTKSSAYEFIKIVVGVSYGTEVEQVRNVILDALNEVQTKDRFGRDLVDPKNGISVVLDDFGDNSVNIAVKQYVLVSERNAYIARTKEIIYNALNKAEINIPFPQCDVYIKETPQG